MSAADHTAEMYGALAILAYLGVFAGLWWLRQWSRRPAPPAPPVTGPTCATTGCARAPVVRYARLNVCGRCAQEMDAFDRLRLDDQLRGRWRG